MAIKKQPKKKTKKPVKKAKKQKKPFKKTKMPVRKKASKPAAKPKKVLKAKKRVAVTKEKTKTEQPLPKKIFIGERGGLLRKLLIQTRENIVKEAKAEISKYIRGENRQLVDTALDDGDWSIVDLSEDISLRQLGLHRENLVKIDAALRKLEEGTYGICEDCGEDISKERLKVLPFAIYCRDCQEKMEQLEAIEKELPI